MLCPKCYGKVNKYTNRCDFCGFDLKTMQGATNSEAKKALRGIYKDDVLYTNVIPQDVSKKKLLLFSIFLGLFGVHNFYIGRFWKGLYMCLSTSIVLLLAIILTATGSLSNNIFQRTFEFMTIFQGINVILWVVDIFKIAFEKYKIPVYKEDFSKFQEKYKYKK